MFVLLPIPIATSENPQPQPPDGQAMIVIIFTGDAVDKLHKRSRDKYSKINTVTMGNRSVKQLDAAGEIAKTCISPAQLPLTPPENKFSDAEWNVLRDVLCGFTVET